MPRQDLPPERRATAYGFHPPPPEVSWSAKILSMDLRPETLHLLEQWLGCDTWHTRHHTDTKRFFHFVDALRVDIGTLDGEESNLMDLMLKTLQESGWRGSPEYTRETLRDYKRDIWTILDFCEECGI